MGLDIFFEKTKQVGYFRKVNFLVKFFEDLGFNVETQYPLYINQENIIELINKCKLALDRNNDPSKILPTMKGPFFGSTEYSEHYYNDVENVLKYCEETLLPMFYNLKEDESIYFSTWY